IKVCLVAYLLVVLALCINLIRQSIERHGGLRATVRLESDGRLTLNGFRLGQGRWRDIVFQGLYWARVPVTVDTQELHQGVVFITVATNGTLAEQALQNAGLGFTNRHVT